MEVQAAVAMVVEAPVAEVLAASSKAMMVLAAGEEGVEALVALQVASMEVLKEVAAMELG